MLHQSHEVNAKEVKSGKFGDNETLKGELNEKEIELVRGGLSPEQAAEVRQLAQEAGKHHGINVGATIAGFTVGTIGDFGANALGELAGNKVHQKKN